MRLTTTARTVALRWANLGVDSVRGHAIQEIQLALSAKKLGVKEANRLAAPEGRADRIGGGDLALFGQRLVVLLDLPEVVEIVHHQPVRLAQAIGRDIAKDGVGPGGAVRDPRQRRMPGLPLEVEARGGERGSSRGPPPRVLGHGKEVHGAEIHGGG